MPRSQSQTQGQMPPPPIPTNLNTRGGNIHIYFAPRTKPGSQHSLDATGWKKNVHNQSRKAIANFWYYSNIPFHCAKIPYWQAMIDAVTTIDPGFKDPTSEILRTDLLLESVNVMFVLAEFRSSWVETGCAIMSDGWTNQRNTILINFFVSCPVGTMLLKSVDAQTRLRLANLFVK